MLNASALDVGGEAIAAAYPYLSLHTDTNLSSSSNESSAPRVAANWTVTDGDLVATNIEFTGGAPSGNVRRVGYWSAATGGTFGGSSLLTGDQAFNAAGEYVIDSLTEDASSS